MDTRHRRVGMALLLSLAWGCGSDGGEGNRDGLPGTAGRVQRFLEEEVVPDAEGYRDAAQRLLVAAMGGEADGVTLTPGQFRTGTLEADLDQDGTRETTLTVGITLSSAEPSPTDPVQITVSRGGPGEPLYSITGRLTASLDGTVTVDMASASHESDELSVFAQEGSGTLPLAPEPGTVLGTMGFMAFDPDYTDVIRGTFTLVAVSADGYRIRVNVADDPETPEDESLEFFVE